MFKQITRAGGVPIPARTPVARQLPATLPIQDLVPYEGAVVEGVVSNYRQQIKAGTVPPAVEVVDAAGEWLVVDGNHRVFAAKQEGQTHVAVKAGRLQPAHADSARRAIARGRKGYDETKITIVGSDQERAVFTTKEIADDEAEEFRASLAGKLKDDESKND